MTADKCRPVVVDGEVIRVLGDGEMDATDREMFADLVRAAKRRYADAQDDDLVFAGDDEYPDIDDDVPMRDVVNAPVAGDLL
jgi:hypothetical protein